MASGGLWSRAVLGQRKRARDKNSVGNGDDDARKNICRGRALRNTRGTRIVDAMRRIKREKKDKSVIGDGNIAAGETRAAAIWPRGRRACADLWGKMTLKQRMTATEGFTR